MLTSLLKAAVSVAVLPVTAVADVLTLNGALQDRPRDKGYTAEALANALANLQNAARPNNAL